MIGSPVNCITSWDPKSALGVLWLKHSHRAVFNSVMDLGSNTSTLTHLTVGWPLVRTGCPPEVSVPDCVGTSISQLASIKMIKFQQERHATHIQTELFLSPALGGHTTSVLLHSLHKKQATRCNPTQGAETEQGYEPQGGRNCCRLST